MPKRELRFSDGKSDKFWTISLKGKTHTVVYGRINTAGRTLSKMFDTPSEARASYTSLIESKLKKGYRDTAPKRKRAAKKRPATKGARRSTSTISPTKKSAKSSHGSSNKFVSLNDLTRRVNMIHCEFRDKRDMADHCRYVWTRLFVHLRVLEPWVDAAIWEIGPTVQVRPACTALDESHRSFIRPLPIYFEVRGYKQEKRKFQKQGDPEALERELMERMREAILKGFMHKRAQKSYTKYNPDDRPFTVLVTKEDKGLHASEFTVIWQNRRGSSAAQIRKKQAAAKGKKPATKLQEESGNKQHLAKLSESRKREREASRKYWAKEKEKAEQRKPAIRKRLAAQIELAETKHSKPTNRRPKGKTTSRKNVLWSLDDGNQHERQLVPTVKLDRLVHIVATYPWPDFNQADNRLWEYMSVFINPLLAKSRMSGRALWERMNRAQKVFYTLVAFDGDTSNGGVWQFLFNRPELALAALEAMEEIGEKKLARDYRATLEEYLGKARSLSGLRKRADDKNLSTEKQWQAFAEGYGELKTAAKIEKYFHTGRYKKTLYKKISDYIEQSYHLFAKVKV